MRRLPNRLDRRGPRRLELANLMKSFNLGLKEWGLHAVSKLAEITMPPNPDFEARQTVPMPHLTPVPQSP